MAKINVQSGGAAPLQTGELQLASGAAMSSTLTAVTDQANTASPLLLSTTGVQVQSTLRITTDSNPYIDAEDGATNNRFTVGRAPASQQVNVDFASNPTGSTTVVGAIRTYVDGVNLSEVMTFREDGNVGIGTNAPTQALEIGGGNNIKLNNNGSLYLNSVRYATNNGSIYVGDINATNTPIYLIPQGGGANGSVRLGGGQLALFKGSGSTSATTSLLVQNSSGTQLLKISDDATMNFGNASNQGDYTFVGSSIVAFKLNDTLNSRTLTFYKNAGSNYIIDSNSDTRLSYGWNGNYFFRLVGTTKSMAISSTTSDPMADASSIVDFQSTTKGFLPPRMTEAQILAIASPAIGLMAYNTDKDCPVFYSAAGWRKVSHSAM